MEAKQDTAVSDDETVNNKPKEPVVSEIPDSTKAPTFLGSQLIKTASGINRDVMIVVLSPTKQYTESEAKSLIDKFLKKEVITDGRRKLDDAE